MASSSEHTLPRLKTLVWRRFFPADAIWSLLICYIPYALSYTVFRFFLGAEAYDEARNVFLVLLNVSHFAAGLGVAKAYLACLFVESRATRPLEKIAQSVRHRLASGLSQPIRIVGEALETQEVIDAFRTLFARLDARILELCRSIRTFEHDTRDRFQEIADEEDDYHANESTADNVIEVTHVQIAEIMDALSRCLRLAKDYSRVNGEPQSPVDVCEQARRCVQQLTRAAERKRIAIKSKIDGSPLCVLAHPQTILEIMHNLVGNALKYTPEGGRIEVAVSPKSSQVLIDETKPPVSLTTHVELAVDDNGPGIPESEREAVFEEGHRGSSATGKPGTGLGLAIVRTLARAYGGTVTCESSHLGGAHFALTLKLCPKGIIQ